MMKNISRITILAMVALAAFAFPATASAERIYYLVGVRHVYRIGADKYFHANERKQIEQDYADEVSADNAHYQYQISHGGNVDNESAQLSSALHDLAAEREDRLAALYERCDYVRNNHPSFNITVDGPYQVIGVGYHVYQSVEVWDDYTCYAPWPGYVCEGPNPYGWSYGVVYTPGVFISTYHGWYGGWVGFGSPAFVGFYGFGGPIVCAGLSINLSFGFGAGHYYSNPGLGGYYHVGPGYFAHDVFRGGYIANRRDSRYAVARQAGYAAGASAIRSARAAGYASGIRAGARSSFASGFAHGAAAATHSGYAHSYTGATSRPSGGSFGRSSAGTRPTSGYAHSITGGSRPSGGSFGRSSTPARSSSGSFGRTGGFRSSATSHTSTTRSNSGGVSRYSRPTSSHASGTTRSFGSSHSTGRSFGGGTSHSRGSFGGGSSHSSGGSFGGSRSSGGSHSSSGGHSGGSNHHH